MTPFQVKPELAEKLAKKGFPNGGTVRCGKCQAERHADLGEISKWLIEGMPLCKKCLVKIELINPYARQFTA